MTTSSTSTPDADLRLLDALHRVWGFAEFRPLQREAMHAILDGRDSVVVLPTGGGKSLCFQAPAIVDDAGTATDGGAANRDRHGLALVVSPLISLMKDQVDALQASGIAATVLNSTLTSSEGAKRTQALRNGEYDLLYVAPERLMLSGFLANLKAWEVNQIAIDEAHCISEWGHDFRPEYRQLAQLREHFPHTPVMALTATATNRVRTDILKQLRLREPKCYVASFNRPNLTYRVLPKNSAYKQLLKFISARPDESGIVYCQSRNSTENVAARLKADGIVAEPYHAGLDKPVRERQTAEETAEKTQAAPTTDHASSPSANPAPARTADF